MLRSFVVTVIVSCFAAAGWAQSPAKPPASPTSASSKPVVKKAPPKAKAAAKRPAAAEVGPCRLGVISAIGDHFSVRKIGLTVFENEANEIPIDWGLDDIVLARVRAATGGDPTVRKVAYPKGAFEPFYNPKSRLIRDPSERLPAIVRNITLNANCERYLVATKGNEEVPGTNQIISGVGAYNRGIGSLLRHSHLFASISLSLIDGRTYEEINRPFANFGANLSQGISLTEDPLTKLENSSFPEPPTSASSSAPLRERTRALVAARLDRLLPGYLKEE